MEIYAKFKECSAVTVEGRGVAGGEMYFALDSAGADVPDALAAGARYAVVGASSEIGTACAGGRLDADVADRLIVVDDVFKTLQELGRWHRAMTFVDGKPLTVIAVTGLDRRADAVKEIRGVLSEKYSVTATEDGQNDGVGVPLTLLKIDSQTKVVLVEMAAGGFGDIKKLVDIALPNYGLITDVDKDDVHGLGQLYDYLRRTSDKVFLDVDDPVLCRMASDRNLQSDPERPYSLLIPYGTGCAESSAALAIGDYFD